jgi:hypothetical protein
VVINDHPRVTLKPTIFPAKPNDKKRIGASARQEAID